MVEEVSNVLRILRETLDALETKDSIKLKSLSNQTIHSASISQDPSNVAIAVIVYSLSKIIERKDYASLGGWKEFYDSLVQTLEQSIENLENKNEIAFKENIKKIRESISKVSGKLKNYIEDVFRKAKINKASKVYEHGISMEQTAKMLGITIWELANYSGGRDHSDVPENKTVGTKERIKLAMGMFS
jgi:predicted RNA-binding protein